ncbi:MAG: cation:proton antiporter [Lachnospiraceae bacterium]|nr:cation:proton antiporter [Lachnospiraceae bacterium]MDD3659908.1 cation:proton antiporter [Lachnospiraceae bacterium]
MLTSLSLIFLLGLSLGKIFNRLKLPSLLGMILTGMILSPFALNLLDESILAISPDLRQLALIIILTRAGLSLDIEDLKKVGRPAILMCFVPACFEILGVLVIAPRVFGMTYLEAAIMGSVIAAVSPAVIVPRMIKIMEEGYGKERSIPQLILAGASVDDVFVIVLFTAFTSLAAGGEVTAASFLQIPVSIILGIILGVLTGLGLTVFFRKFHMRDTVKLIIILSISCLLIELQNRLEGIVPISGLLAIMSMGIAIYQKYHVLAKRLSVKYNKLWVAAEVLLFVLVGATVDLQYAFKAGVFAVMIVLGALVFRMVGVLVCMIRTKLSKKERVFCMLAYTPKATVQAAIGAIPLAMGLACGQQVLTVAVLSILITAPFGAICVDHFYKKLLIKK